MGLILGIIIIVIDVLGSLFILFTNDMSDVPSQNGISIWPWLITCLCIGGFLIFTHYVHISW